MLRTHRLRLALLSTLFILPLVVLAEDDQRPAKDGKPQAKESAAKDSAPAKQKSSDKKAKGEKAGEKKTSEPKADEKSKPEAAKPAAAIVKVKKGKFKVEVSLDGVLESKNMVEVSIHPDSWSEFSVDSAVAHGEMVKKGDTLITFDATKLDEQISDVEAGKKLAELSLEQLRQEVRLLEQAIPLELRVAERSTRLAEADLQQFLSQDRDLTKKEADFRVKMYANFLEYQKEELKQLEKMYKADDLTEETEEIILKRTRDQVEQVEFSNEIAKIEREQTLKIQLPRREDLLKENVNRATLALQRTRTTLPISLDKARLELERQKFEHARADEKLVRLKHDRDLMTVTAPADGIVYYGQCQQGHWSSASSVAAKLRKHGRVSADEVVMTIIEPGSLFVRATVPEKELWQVRRGLTGSAQPAGYNDNKLPASVDSLNTIPNADGKFLATILIDSAQLPKDMPPLAAGMSCDAKITTYTSHDALTLPTKVVHADKQADDENYVWLPGKDDKPVRRSVTVGRRTSDTVEITQGLEEGEKVLREVPKEEEEE